MNDEQEARYKVIFLGPVHNDLANVNKLAEGLKDRFKLSEEAVTKMMRTAPVAIKKEATLAEAQQYKEVLEALGAKVQVDLLEEVKEEVQQTEESPPPLDQEPQIIPVEAETPPPPTETGTPEKEEPQQTEESPPSLDREPESVSVQEIPLPPSSETGAPEKEEPQQTEEAPPPLDRKPQVIPVKAKTPPPSSETAATEQVEAGQQMIKCPQCGYVQEETDECFKCGVIISKFLKVQEEVKPAGIGRVAPGAVRTPTAEGPQPQRILGTPMEEPSGYSPWEDMANLGFFAAFFRTMREVLFSPMSFFREMPVDKNIHYSLIYGIIMGFFVALSGLLWQFAFSGLMGGGEGMQGMEALFTPFLFIIYAFFLPFVITFSLFMYTGMLHTMLIVVGGNRRGLDATFRVVAYTQSAQVFSLIPILGVFIYLVYTPILFAIGFKQSHQITTGKAVLAVILPLLIVLGFGIIIAVMFVPLILSLIPQMMMQQQPPGF